MLETAPTNGLRPKSYWYVLPNLGRWLFILVAFTYMLAVALALFEAVKLQSLVKSLAGDETRARAALLALHEHRDWQGTGKELNYAAMVVSLDKLKAATRSLALLDGSFSFPDGGDGAGDDGVRPADVFEQNVDQLEIALIDLQHTVGDAAPGVGIAASIAKLGRVVDGLKGYTEDPKRSDGSQASKQTPASVETADLQIQQSGSDQQDERILKQTQRLQDQLGDLVALLDDLRQRVETEASAELANHKLEDVQRQVAAFSNAVAKGRMGYGEDVVRLKDAASEEPDADTNKVQAVDPSGGMQTVKTVENPRAEMVQKVAAKIEEAMDVNPASPERVAKHEHEADTEASLKCIPSLNVDRKLETDCNAEIGPGHQLTVSLPADAFVHEYDAPLTFTAFELAENQRDGLPQWLRFDPVLRTFCGSPADGDAGNDYTIGVRATDPNGAFAEGIFHLVVSSEEREPKPPAVDGTVACPLPDYQQRLAGLATSLTEFERTLLRADPELAVAKQLSAQIVAIGEAAGSLRRLKPGADLRYRDPTGERTGSAALAVFNQQQQMLSQTADSLEEILGKYSPAMAVGLKLGDDPEAQFKASVIWSDFQALRRFEPILVPLRRLEASGSEAYGLPPAIAGLGLRPQKLATLGNEVLTLVLVLVIGALGSLIFMTKRQLGGALQGIGLMHKPDVGFAWYLFRPIFGVVVAFAIYLLYKAGQIALGGGGADDAFAGINVPILSVIALFAGLLSWQALDMIEGRGRAWLGSVERRDLWATGLDNALRSLGRSLRECADQVGRSVGQVERWIGCRDKVTPEMQDRLVTWTGRNAAELFSDKRPEDAVEARPMWARGLERVLTSNGRALDAKALAEILGEDADRVASWVKCDRQVSPAMQWRIVEVLGVRHSEVFEHDDRTVDRWAVGLRLALEKSGLGGAEELAKRIGADVTHLRHWMELQERVPLEMQAAIARVLNVGERQLFADEKPDDSRFRWATQLRDRMRDKGVTVDALAKEVDADPGQVWAWQDLDLGRGRVASATQDRIAEVLGKPKDAIFGLVREGDAFRWGTGLRAKLEERKTSGKRVSDAATLAKELDSDPKLVERWVAVDEKAPPAAQGAIAAILETDRSELFSDVKT